MEFCLQQELVSLKSKQQGERHWSYYWLTVLKSFTVSSLSNTSSAGYKPVDKKQALSPQQVLSLQQAAGVPV